MQRLALAVMVLSLVPAAALADGTFSVGAGYNSDEGFIAGTQLSHDDLFHSGQKLALSAQISKLHERAAIEHVLPLGDGLELTTELFYDRRHLPGFAREGVGGSVTLGAHVSKALRVYLRARVEDITTIRESINIARGTDGSLRGQLGDGTLLSLGAGLAYDTTDGPIPLHGTRLELSGESADPRLGSDYQLTKLYARFDHARPIFGGPLTLRVSARAGYVTSRDPNGVPMAERLFHDGNRDLRGYSLGGIDAGANFEALGRVELEAPLYRKAGLSIAGFFDAGVTYNEDLAWGGGQGKEIRRAVGGSLIWRSPIGPLRLDVALPLDGTVDKRVLFTFGMGF